MCVHLFVTFTVFATCMCGAVGARDAAELKTSLQSCQFFPGISMSVQRFSKIQRLLEMLQRLEKMRHSGQKGFQI